MNKSLFGKFFVFLLVVGLLFAVAPTMQAQAATLDVCSSGCAYTSIQAAINAAADGDTILVGPGTYNEPLLINKPLTVKSTDGAATTIISKDVIYVVIIRSSNVIFDGFTVMSPGFNGAGADLGGIMIGYYGDNSLTNIKVKNNIVTQIGDPNRIVTPSDWPSVGICVNGVIDGLEITGNTIHDLTQVVNDNTVTYGPTGIAFYGYDTTPLSTNVVISGNTIYNIGFTGTGTGAIANGIRAGWGSGNGQISGNTIYDIEGRGIAVTSANNGAPVITGNTISSSGEGVFMANAGGGSVSNNTFHGNVTNINVTGAAVGNVTTSGNITTVKNGESIQAAIDAAIAGDTINVYPGVYSETAANRVIYAQPAASYTFGLFFDYSKPGITLQGVKADGTVIINPADIAAKITTISDANFGPSGVFVDADNITITGLEIGDNYKAGVITNNKTIEVIADNFTFKNNVISTTGGGSLYFGEFAYVGTPESARIKAYTVEGNLFKFNATVDISSGTGVEGLASSRVIKNNAFTSDGAATQRAVISFNGKVESIAWYLYPVGGATITGNSFTEIALPIRSRGIVENDFNWESYLEDNTFDKAVVAWNPATNMPRAWSYTSGTYLIDNVMAIGTSIQTEIGHAADGDTVKVLPGTYAENVIINKPNLTVKSTDGAATTIIDVPNGTLTTGVLVSGTNLGTITFEGFTVKNFTESGIVQGMASATGTTFHVLNNVVIPAANYLRNGIQVSGNGSTVIGNTVTSASLTADWSGTAINVINASNVIVRENTITGGGDVGIGIVNYNATLVDNIIVENNVINGPSYAISVQGGPHATGKTVQNIVVRGNDLGAAEVGMDFSYVTLLGTNVIEKNNFSEAETYIVIYKDGWGTTYPGSNVNGMIDASPNWFGSIAGPNPELFVDEQNGDTFNFVLSTYAPWCGDAACSFLVYPMLPAGLQASIDATPVQGVLFVPDVYDDPTVADYTTGASLDPFFIRGQHLILEDGVIISNTNASCFDIRASHSYILTQTPGGAKCVIGQGKWGVQAWTYDIDDMVVDGLEITGIALNGTVNRVYAGIAFMNPKMSNVSILNNYIHDIIGPAVPPTNPPSIVLKPAIWFDFPVTGEFNIQGNLFQRTAGFFEYDSGLGYQDVNAEYNSWGAYTVTTSGDNHVDFDPYTHAEIKLEPTLANYTFVDGKVTYEVWGVFKNIFGADFTLTYDPAVLEIDSITPVTGFFATVPGEASLVNTSAAGKIRYQGVDDGNQPYTSPDANGTLLYTVTFKPVAAAKVTTKLGIDAKTDNFAMILPWDYDYYTTNVFGILPEDITVAVIDHPTVTSSDIQGYYLVGEAREFHVTADNPATGGSFDHVIFQFNVTASAGNLALEYWTGTAWANLPLTCASGVCSGYYGPSTGFAMASPYNATSLFRVTAAVAGSYPVEIKLIDLDTEPDTVLTTYTNTAVVYDKPVVAVSGDAYYLVGDTGAFQISITNPSTGKNYSNTAVFDIVLPGHVIADFSAISCTMGATTWDLLPMLTQDGTAVKARIVGKDGYLTIPAGMNGSIGCSATFATAGTYAPTGHMVDVVSATEERIVSADFSDSKEVYTKPVIDASALVGPFQVGVAKLVNIEIDNVDGMFSPNTYTLHLDLPAGTVVNGVTCTATGCNIPVTLAEGENTVPLTITFNAAFVGLGTVQLVDPAVMAGRILAADTTDTNVVALANISIITGTVTMQGRQTRAGVPVMLSGPTGFIFGPYSATSTEVIGANLKFTNLASGIYTITTSQPRYLNLALTDAKTIDISTHTAIASIRLLAGNAVWTTNNKIDMMDSGQVGTDWGQTFASTFMGDCGDVNFDGIVSINDLALVGGNMDLGKTTSAYASWMP